MANEKQTPKTNSRSKKVELTPEEQAELALWGKTPTTWHPDAKAWYEALRVMSREWSPAEVAHARFLADDLSSYKKTIPRNAAMAKVVYVEMSNFMTTPKSYDDALNARPSEDSSFQPSPELLGEFYGKMRFGPAGVPGANNE